MGYNIAGLPAYTSQESRVFIARSILGAATIALLTQFGSFDPTAKGSEAVQLLNTDVQIQDGTNCGRTPLGGATLAQSILTVKALKINQDYCTRDLEKVWAVEELKAIIRKADVAREISHRSGISSFSCPQASTLRGLRSRSAENPVAGHR